MSVSKEQVGAAYEQFGTLVFQRCLYILGERQKAEDALQEVFVRFIKYGKDLKHIDAPVRWFYKIAENTCYDMIKDAKRHPLPTEDTQTYEKDPPVVSPLHEIIHRDVVTKIFEQLDDPMAREVLLLYYRDGLTQHQVAEQTGVSRQTIHNKLNKIKQHIHQFKKQSGI